MGRLLVGDDDGDGDKWWMVTQFKLKHLAYLQCNFSSKLPLDVTDSARMNSSNSIEPSCEREKGYQVSLKLIQHTTRNKDMDLRYSHRTL